MGPQRLGAFALGPNVGAGVDEVPSADSHADPATTRCSDPMGEAARKYTCCVGQDNASVPPLRLSASHQAGGLAWSVSDEERSMGEDDSDTTEGGEECKACWGLPCWWLG